MTDSFVLRIFEENNIQKGNSGNVQDVKDQQACENIQKGFGAFIKSKYKSNKKNGNRYDIATFYHPRREFAIRLEKHTVNFQMIYQNRWKTHKIQKKSYLPSNPSCERVYHIILIIIEVKLVKQYKNNVDDYKP